jgi:hypothetical protein
MFGMSVRSTLLPNWSVNFSRLDLIWSGYASQAVMASAPVYAAAFAPAAGFVSAFEPPPSSSLPQAARRLTAGRARPAAAARRRRVLRDMVGL